MTPAAWVMMSVTWLVVTGFVVRLLVAVLRTPPRDSAQQASTHE